MDDASKELSENNEAISKYRQQIDELKKQNQEQQQEIEQLNEKNQTLQQEIGALNEENKTIKEAKEEQEAQNKLAKQEHITLKHDLEQEQKVVQDLRKALKETEEDINSYQMERDAGKNKINRLENDLKKLGDNAANKDKEMLEENERLRDEIIALQAQLKQQQMDNKNAKKSKELGDAFLNVKNICI